jgi:serine/threonine-protein phosphatase 2A activator
MTHFASFPRVQLDAPFSPPTKQINSEADVARFNRSVACERIVGFIMLLNDVVKGRNTNENFQQSESIRALGRVLDELNGYIDEIPPSTGPRRFGNVAFRLWVKKMEEVFECLDIG